MTTRWWMIAVAVAAFSLGGLAWSLRSQAPHVHDLFLQIGPYVVSSTSPAFRVILGLGSAVLPGLAVGLVAMAALAARAIGRGLSHKP